MMYVDSMTSRHVMVDLGIELYELEPELKTAEGQR